MSMKLAINARFQQRPITGVDRYAHEISKRLTLEKYFISPKYPLRQISGHLWEQFILPIKIQDGNLLWSPANAGPWLVRDQVVSIHDASIFDHPEWFKSTFGLWTRLSWKILAKRVKAIITVSNFSKERLKFHLGIPEEKIHVIYNGVVKPFEPKSEKAIEAVKEKYKLNQPYFLFVGTNEPRKNLAVISQACESLKLISHSLFIAGANGRVFANTHYDSNATYVVDEDLPALYSGASAVVVPSFYEGFGLTILEALACGTPVIASDIAVFREMFDGAVLFFNPHDPNELANAMLKIIDDKTLAAKMREHGIAHAARYSWDESARKTQILLESLR